VRLDSSKVSRRHARVLVRDGGVTLEDLGSKNGTFVRDARIRQAVTVQPGDVIRIGGFRLTNTGTRAAPVGPSAPHQRIDIS
jgi:pSer/pThr/pTyr-binding forkhead associated (FHA) protein